MRWRWDRGRSPDPIADPDAGAGAGDAVAELAERLGRAPFIDQHAHTIGAGWAALTVALPEWRRCFTEATAAASIERDVPATTGYREFIHAYGAYLGVPEAGDLPVADLEPAVVAARQERVAADGEAVFLRALFDDAAIEALLVDTGFAPTEGLAPADLADACDRPVRTIVRVETVVEAALASLGSKPSPAALREQIRDSLVEALDGGAVGMKSVAAYRSGLSLVAPVDGEVRRALGDAAGQARRVSDPALVGLGVWTAATLGAERAAPLQFHVGFGDTDVHLPTADPTLLRELLRDPRTEACPIVLLHCHPFVDGAAYLASAYPQVHVDLSLTIPLLGGAGARRAIESALALCPATKLLAGSDGHSYPEMHWRGARLWREALASVLGGAVGEGRLSAVEAVSTGEAILAGNARRLYRL